jgi:hypothetical protein
LVVRGRSRERGARSAEDIGDLFRHLKRFRWRNSGILRHPYSLSLGGERVGVRVDFFVRNESLSDFSLGDWGG